MKICGIICEYNPFHNGHAYLLDEARKQSGCDAVVCVMSGDFTQRGEMAVLDKYTRAKHAVLAGADAVIELPVPFACAPAELFAKGAIKLLSSLPDFSILAFGSETGDKQPLFAAAQAQADSEQDSSFKTTLKKYLKAGLSLTKARSQALAETGKAETAQLLSSPNDILAVEYVKAMTAFECGADILPIKRVGAGYSDEKLLKNFSSATAIRNAVTLGKRRAIKKNVPPFVLEDLKQAADPSVYKKIALCAALKMSAEQMKKMTDCTEGLENRIKAFAKNTPDYDEFVSKVTTKRYISSRIRRILAATVLELEEEFVRKALRAPLYLKVLAAKKESADKILPALRKSAFPLLTRRSDLSLLGKIAEDVYAKDELASDIFRLAAALPRTEGQLRLI